MYVCVCTKKAKGRGEMSMHSLCLLSREEKTHMDGERSLVPGLSRLTGITQTSLIT